MRRVLLGLPVLLAGCGSAKGLQPPAGVALPVAPYGAERQRTPGELITPTTQQRPQRADELLRNSEERRLDDFDLPPEG